MPAGFNVPACANYLSTSYLLIYPDRRIFTKPAIGIFQIYERYSTMMQPPGGCGTYRMVFQKRQANSSSGQGPVDYLIDCFNSPK
jgi:hypothetical protein